MHSWSFQVFFLLLFHVLEASSPQTEKKTLSQKINSCNYIPLLTRSLCQKLKVKFLTLYSGDSQNTLLSPAAHSPCVCIPTPILQTWKAILDSEVQVSGCLFSTYQIAIASYAFLYLKATSNLKDQLPYGVIAKEVFVGFLKW